MVDRDSGQEEKVRQDVIAGLRGPGWPDGRLRWRQEFKPSEMPVTWATMSVPDEGTLSAALRRLLAAVVVGDSRATRTEDQLRDLTHLMLVKLESDAVASRSGNADKPVAFQIRGGELGRVQVTAKTIREQFRSYFAGQRARIFHPDDRDEIYLTDETIYAVVAELSQFRLLGDDIDLLAKAFQIFRGSALKLASGQFLTPQRIIRPCVTALDIRSGDKVIDPACGAGGFIVEALRQVRDRDFPDPISDRWHLVKWANENLYGVDIDHVGIKLTQAIMMAAGDGSTHILLGDSIRRHQWSTKHPRLNDELGGPADGGPADSGQIAEQFTVVVTNPPFGEDLKVKAGDARSAGFTIARDAAHTSGEEYVDLEIGLLFLEQAHRLLQVGGRVGIVLPETYFFSRKYRWLTAWLDGRLRLRGMLNIPMEAFEEFCRAKTNFYIFEKVGHGIDVTKGRVLVAIHKPSWFSDNTVMISTAPTCGLTKGGRTLPKIDPETGRRIQVKDPETGELADAIDDVLLDDMIALREGRTTDTLRFIRADEVSIRLAVPVYYDRRYEDSFEAALSDDPVFKGFTSLTVAEMIEAGLLTIRGGHGSPSQEQRVGDVPYIKVSDLRAGTVNINPTNRVPRAVAQQQFWRGKSSGLLPFDLLSPERTSKNIGDFCVLMPGQEQVVVTKEVIILRPGPSAQFDAFYLLWAFSLHIVREQWKRVVFMQTNREDVGKRYHEIRVPIAPSTADAAWVSAAFRSYYTTMAKEREDFAAYLDNSGRHHFFVSGAEEQALPGEAAIASEQEMTEVADT